MSPQLAWMMDLTGGVTEDYTKLDFILKVKGPANFLALYEKKRFRLSGGYVYDREHYLVDEKVLIGSRTRFSSDLKSLEELSCHHITMYG